MSTHYNLPIKKTVFYCERSKGIVHGTFIRSSQLQGKFRVWRDEEGKLVSNVIVDDQLAQLRAVPRYEKKRISSHQEEINEFLSFFEIDKEGINVLKLDIAARAFTCAIVIHPLAAEATH